MVIFAAMDFRTFWLEMPPKDRREFADRCGAAVGHLHNIAYGCKQCGPTLAIVIARESGGKVSLESLCREADWEYVRGTPSPRRHTEQRAR